MRGKSNKNVTTSKKRRVSSGFISNWQGMRDDAMAQYLAKYDWLEGNQELRNFNILKHKEHFSKTENLDFEEAINAVRIYEKINIT